MGRSETLLGCRTSLYIDVKHGSCEFRDRAMTSVLPEAGQTVALVDSTILARGILGQGR